MTTITTTITADPTHHLVLHEDILDMVEQAAGHRIGISTLKKVLQSHGHSGLAQALASQRVKKLSAVNTAALCATMAMRVQRLHSTGSGEDRSWRVAAQTIPPYPVKAAIDRTTPSNPVSRHGMGSP